MLQFFGKSKRKKMRKCLKMSGEQGFYNLAKESETESDDYDHRTPHIRRRTQHFSNITGNWSKKGTLHKNSLDLSGFPCFRVIGTYI